jgi:CelD/BcsL family acetyltransferase involved in cellulose biosynthesis
MDIEIIESIETFRELQEPWELLLRRYPNAPPYMSFEWLLSWLETLGRRAHLLTIVASTDGAIRGIAPLCVQPGKVLTFIGYPQNDYADLLVDPETPAVLEEIVNALGAHRNKWNKVLLDQLHQNNSQSAALATTLRARGWPFRLEQGDTCPAMSLNDIAAARKMYHKKNLNTYVNWFKHQGSLEFTVHSDTATALARLDDLFAQHIERWNGTATPSVYRKPEAREFCRSFVRRMHPKGWVKVASLSLDREYLAFSIFFEFNDIMYLYRPSFNPKYGKRSPGQVILRFLFEYAVERRMREMDFARGDEGYKGRFATVARRSQRVIVYKDRWSMVLASAYYALRQSRLVDVLYRNRPVRKAKYQVLQAYRNRKGRTPSPVEK